MWLHFILYGAIATVALWLVERPRSPLMRVAGLAACAALVASVYFLYPNAQTLGPTTSWYQTDAGRYGLWFIAMVLGMVVRHLNEAIEVRSELIAQLRKENIKFKKPKLELDGWMFARPLLFSVVTFGGLLSQLHSQTLTIESIVLSFQSGFFWQTLLAHKERTIAS